VCRLFAKAGRDAFMLANASDVYEALAAFNRAVDERTSPMTLGQSQFQVMTSVRNDQQVTALQRLWINPAFNPNSRHSESAYVSNTPSA
jgi:hypothetical protein